MRFAEFTVCRQIEAGPYTVTEAEILQFARQYAPQWFHTDPEAASAGPFEGLIASGWQTCGIAMRLTPTLPCTDLSRMLRPDWPM